MNIEYGKVIQKIKLTCTIEKDGNDILNAIAYCNDNGYTIVKQGCPIDSNTLLPDIKQYIIIAQKEI